MKALVLSLRLVLWTTILLGFLYPLAVTGLAQVFFAFQANGSLVAERGEPVGSFLIGQDFSKASGYFIGRPSATGDHPYNPLASGGSNLSVVGKVFQDSVKKLRDTWRSKAEAAGIKTPVPEALVTASASGLDPDLDLQAALWEAPIVAQERKMDVEAVQALVRTQAVKPVFPWDPPAFVNVLELNLALDKSSNPQEKIMQ
ncbi:MAG: potassium-transporting ATPase subunit KdpC [Spirochaetales bacterium]|nr:potassium-transporting ATPase subunit KdpC [Spirochaetales bacterium]